MKETDFNEILMKNKEEDLIKYVSAFGKQPKPFSPIYFLDMSKDNTINQKEEK